MAVDIGRPGLLRVEGLSKRFQATRALDDVSFSLAEGQVLALVGENGAGKSTLVRVLSGVHAADRGHTEIAGRRTAFTNPHEAIAAGVVVIPQELRIVPQLSVAENIMLGHLPSKSLLGVPYRRDDRRLHTLARAAADRIGLSIDLGLPAGDLTFAERQMIVIARALSHDARILILDEPTASLERRETEHLFAVLHRLKAQGIAAIYISHRLEELSEIADRCIVMRDGRIVAAYERTPFDTDRIMRDMSGRGDEALTRPHDGAFGPVLVSADLGGGTVAARRREIVGLAGLLGSGVSAILHRMFGAHARRAEVMLAGAPARLRSPGAAVARGIGLVPNERRLALIPALSIRDNIVLPHLGRFRTAFGRNEAAIDEAVQRLIVALDVRPADPRKPVRALSGGNQQKVAFAKWMVGRLDLLLLDEPTQGIDVAAKARLHRVIRDFAAAGGSVVFTSSDMPEMLSLSDTILPVRKGRIAGRMVRGDAFSERRLRALLEA